MAAVRHMCYYMNQLLEEPSLVWQMHIWNQLRVESITASADFKYAVVTKGCTSIVKFDIILVKGGVNVSVQWHHITQSSQVSFKMRHRGYNAWPNMDICIRE